MNPLAYKTQVIFFWLLVLVITFVVYTAKLSFEPLFLTRTPEVQEFVDEDEIEKLPAMLNSTHMYNSMRNGMGKIINSTLGMIPE